MTEAEFPVESFREAAPHLRRPFTSAAVKFKVQANFGGDNPTGGLIVGYIDARLAIERLNLICPHLWSDAYTPVGSGQMWCHLTVDGITRHDVGEGQSKGLVSDALKRAAVKFGVGVSLYALPSTILNVSDGMLKVKGGQGKKTLEITPKGAKSLRDGYERWLRDHGREAFGEPLSHGDVEGAQGDHEAEAPPAPEAPASVSDVPATTEVPKPIGDTAAAEIILNSDSAGIPRDDLRKAVWYAAGQPSDRLGAGMFEDGPNPDQYAIDALKAFDEAQRKRVEDWLDKRRAKMADEAKGATA